MANDYQSFYRRDLNDMIDRATIAAIRKSQNSLHQGEENCPVRMQLTGIFNVIDELRMLMDGETEEE